MSKHPPWKGTDDFLITLSPQRKTVTTILENKLKTLEKENRRDTDTYRQLKAVQGETTQFIEKAKTEKDTTHIILSYDLLAFFDDEIY